MLKDLLTGLADLFFPRLCLLCRGPVPEKHSTALVCPACLAKLRLNRPPFCRRCSRPLERSSQDLCPSCRRARPHFDEAWSPAVYCGGMRELLHNFKYHNRTGLRLVFSDLLVTFLGFYRMDISRTDLIVPIPLHPARMRERGFNQALVLAETLGGVLSIPVAPQALSRTRMTKPQSDLGQKERWTNIRGAFKMNYSQPVREKNVLLVDDLLTTGATLSEAARTLKEAGAARVNAVTAAITP